MFGMEKIKLTPKDGYREKTYVKSAQQDIADIFFFKKSAWIEIYNLCLLILIL